MEVMIAVAYWERIAASKTKGRRFLSLEIFKCLGVALKKLLERLALTRVEWK
jgi:hypothetical protein